ncbi:hypothetical protein JHK82_042797 [Glycine max]|nr:hypothetical protein JHK82_042797 [Glycine max]
MAEDIEVSEMYRQKTLKCPQVALQEMLDLQEMYQCIFSQSLLLEMWLLSCAKFMNNWSTSLGYGSLYGFLEHQCFQQQQGILGAQLVAPTTGLRPPVHGSSTQADGTQQHNQQ